MAVSFPLAVTAFMDLLKTEAVVPYLDFQQELSFIGSGGTIAKDLAPALWRAAIRTVPMDHDELAYFMAMIEAMHGSTNTFYCYDTTRRYPKLDPTGSIVGSSAVKINGVSGTTALSLKALPASYVISVGDLLSFDYGSTPSRAFHRALEQVTANGSGVTGNFDVSPPLRSGAAADISVSLKKPSCIMRMVPGSFRVDAGVKFATAGFDAIQVIA